MRYSLAGVSLVTFLLVSSSGYSETLRVINGSGTNVLVSSTVGSGLLEPGVFDWPVVVGETVTVGTNAQVVSADCEVVCGVDSVSFVNRESRRMYWFGLGFGLTGLWGMFTVMYGMVRKGLGDLGE